MTYEMERMMTLALEAAAAVPSWLRPALVGPLRMRRSAMAERATAKTIFSTMV
jgi:hypothetical protein